MSFTVLKKTLIISVLSVFLVFGSYAVLEAKEIDPKYEGKLRAAQGEIFKKLQNTSDKKKRLALIKRLTMLYNAHYHPDVRSLKVKRTNPKWAERVERDKGLTEKDIEIELKRQFEEQLLLSSYIDVADARHWPMMTKMEKEVICKYASQNCETDRFMNCGFVVDRCQPYIDQDIYNAVLIKTGRGAREEK